MPDAAKSEVVQENPVIKSKDADESLSRLPEALRSLRHHNFQLFFFGQLVSLTGTWMQSVAQSWLVYRLTGSAGLLGVVGFANQIPVFLLIGVSISSRRILNDGADGFVKYDCADDGSR